MKTLLLSVLAVAMIGVMFPSVFGEEIWWTNSKDTVAIAFEKYDVVQGDAKNKVVVIEGFVKPKIEQLKQGQSLFAFLGNFAVYIDGERFGCSSYSGYTCAEPDPFQYDLDYGYENELPIWNRSGDYFEWRWEDDLSIPVKFKIFYEVYDNVTTNSQIELYYSPLADEMTNTVWKSKEYKLADLHQLNSEKSESPSPPVPQPEQQPKVESESLEQYEIDMGISIGVPESWEGETTYFPARSKEPATLESVLYSPNGYDEDAVITVFYYGTSVPYSDLTDNEKLEKIIKSEERFDRDSFYDRTEFISTSIKKDRGATIFTLEYESFDDSDSFYNSKTQMFEVHSDYGVWGVYLDVYKESSFARANENIEVFDALKNSFRILGIENNNSPEIFIKSSNSATADISVPTWIKNNAGWWADGTIDDNSFVQGIQFMIKENIISIPYLENSPSDTANSVPAWVKNNAGWWAEGQIDTSAFVEGMRYLVKVGIIKVS